MIEQYIQENTFSPEVNATTDPIKVGMKWGWINAAVSVAVTLLVGLVNPAMFATFSYLGVLALVNILLLVLAGMEFKNKNGGYMTLAQAFQTLMISFAIGSFFNAVFTLLLYNYINPEIPMIIKEEAKKNAIVWMEKFNTPQEAMEAQLEKMDEENYNPGIGKSAIAYLLGLLMGSVMVLIVSAIIKKKRPEEFAG